MKKEFAKKIVDQLKIQKQEIISRQSQIIADIDLSGDEVDEIQGKILANIQKQLGIREQAKLKLIDVALEKINEGTFGLCEECGEQIAEKRLEFNPLFANCIGCAESIELEAKRNKRN